MENAQWPNVLDLSLNTLYEISDPSPARSPPNLLEFASRIEYFMDLVNCTEDAELQARYSVCIFAYLFQNYSFLEDNLGMKRAATERLAALLSSPTRHIFERLGKLEIMEQRLQVLRAPPTKLRRFWKFLQRSFSV